MTYLRKLLSAVLLASAAAAAVAQTPAYDPQRAAEASCNGDYATAVKILYPAYDDGRTDSYENIILGYSLRMAGQHERSLGPLSKALRQIKKNDYESRELILYTRAAANIFIGDKEGALADLDQLDYKGARETSYYTLKARLLYAMGEEAKAIACIDGAIEAMPDSGALYVAKSRILTGIGRGAEAADLLNTAAKKGRLAKSDELSSEIAKAYLASGQMSKALPPAIGAWDEGIICELYDTIPQRVEWQLKAMERNATSRERLLSIRGQLAYRYGDFDTYIAKCRERKRSGGSFLSTNRFIASAHMNAHRPADAQAYVDMLACADSTIQFGRIQLDIWAEQGETAKLKDGMARIFDKENPGDYQYSLCRGLIRLNDKAEAEARIPVLREVAELRRDKVKETVCFANLLEQFGHHDEAASWAMKAIRQAEVDNRMLYVKGSDDEWVVLAYAIADPSDARGDSIASALAARKSATASDLFASACLRSRQGRTSEALALLDRSMRMGAIVAEAHTISLLEGVRKLAEFESTMRPYDEKVAVRARSTEPNIMTLKYENASAGKRIGLSMNGLEVKASIENTSFELISISDDEASFMVKNGYVDSGDIISEYHCIVMKKVSIGDVELRNVTVYVDGSQEEAVTIPRNLLIMTLGTMTEDKAAKTLSFDTSL